MRSNHIIVREWNALGLADNSTLGPFTELQVVLAVWVAQATLDGLSYYMFSFLSLGLEKQLGTGYTTSNGCMV